MNSAINLLSTVVTEHLNQKHGKTQQHNQCALVVTFHNHTLIKDMQTMVSKVAPNLQQYGNCHLIRFYPSREEAQKVANEIDHILWGFDHALIAQEFNPNWLTEYSLLRHFGVDYISAKQELSDPGQIAAWLANSEVTNNEHRDFVHKESAAIEGAKSYTNARMVEDFAQSLSANWDGFKNIDEARQLMAGLIGIMESETKDMSHLPRYPAQRTFMAVEKKAEYLAGLENESDTSKSLVIYRQQESIKNEFEKLTSHNQNNKRWKGCSDHLESYINKNAPSIMLKGLDVLLKDEDAKVEEHEPFAGLDLSFDYMADINKRLSPSRLRYDIQEQGFRQSEQLAGAIAAYYLFVMQLKHESKFKELLIERSKVMDKEPFFDCLLDMVDKSKPDYQAAPVQGM